MKARVMQPERPMPASFHSRRSELGRANGLRGEGWEGGLGRGEGIHAELREDTDVIVLDFFVFRSIARFSQRALKK